MKAILGVEDVVTSAFDAIPCNSQPRTSLPVFTVCVLPAFFHSGSCTVTLSNFHSRYYFAGVLWRACHNAVSEIYPRTEPQTEAHMLRVCMDLSVSLYVGISQKPHVWTSNFLCLLFMSLATFSTGVVAISYVLWCYGWHPVFLKWAYGEVSLTAAALLQLLYCIPCTTDSPSSRTGCYVIFVASCFRRRQVGRARNARAEYAMYHCLVRLFP